MKVYLILRRVMTLLAGLLLMPGARAAAQSYSDSIYAWQHHYKAEFLVTEKSPLTAADTGFIRFYPPDPAWKLPARFTLREDRRDLLLPTYNHTSKPFREYGYLDFEISGTGYRLFVYQNVNYMATDSLHLFLPFTDLTNSETTYGGGRYIDLSVADIRDGHILLDFNKAYNPYCAFAGGYSCPVPPPENSLPVAVAAGEQQFAGMVRE